MGGAAEQLFPLLYDELRRLARSRLAGGARSTLLDTHALLHESFLRLQQAGHTALDDREHFLAYAATTMRSIVVDHVRQRRALRHGGDVSVVTLDTAAANELGASEEEILDIHQALETLQKVEPRLVQVVEMRYFAGLSDVEIAKALGLTDRTVRRDWDRARLLLSGMLGR
jgi:RNA polymerase sigma factor (TIGR02999 family)